MDDYGKVIFKGVEYSLTQDPYSDNFGSGVRYYAHGTSPSGETVLVAWDTTQEWDEAQEEWQEIMQQQHEKYGRVIDSSELPETLWSEDNACDWDEPSSVTVVD